MQIWLDTIDLEVIRDAARVGVLAGITTNPTILSRTKDVKGTLDKILELQKGPIAIQVTSSTPEAMIEEGRSIHRFSPRALIKVPIHRNGLIAIKALREDLIPVMGTAVLYPSQALLAANADAAYIAPYFSHMNKVGDSRAILKEMVEMLKSIGSNTKVLVASLRELDHILYAATLGVDAITIKPDLFYQLVAKEPLVELLLEHNLGSLGPSKPSYLLNSGKVYSSNLKNWFFRI